MWEDILWPLHVRTWSRYGKPATLHNSVFYNSTAPVTGSCRQHVCDKPFMCYWLSNVSMLLVDVRYLFYRKIRCLVWKTVSLFCALSMLEIFNQNFYPTQLRTSLCKKCKKHTFDKQCLFDITLSSMTVHNNHKVALVYGKFHTPWHTTFYLTSLRKGHYMVALLHPIGLLRRLGLRVEPWEYLKPCASDCSVNNKSAKIWVREIDWNRLFSRIEFPLCNFSKADSS